MTAAAAARRLDLKLASELAFKNLQRDWHGGELSVLLIATVLAVASVSAVSFYTARVDLALTQQASTLLAADLVVDSTEPVPASFRERAEALGLEHVETWSFRSVVVAGDALELVQVKAVDAGYPLRGQLTTAAEPFGVANATAEIPAPGTAWADSRLFTALATAVGDDVGLGATELELDRVVVTEPDRGGEMLNLAPRLLVNLADIPASNLVLPGSRVRYRLLVAGETETMADYRNWAQQNLPVQARVRDVRDARPEVRSALDRAGRFLGLAAFTAVIVAGVAIAVSAFRYASRHLDACALMRAVGAEQNLIAAIFSIELLLLGLGGSILGASLGFLAQAVLGGLLGNIAGGILPEAPLSTALPAIGLGVLTVTGFALPPLLRLRAVPPLRVLRRQLAPPSRRYWLLYAVTSAIALGYMAWLAVEPKLFGFLMGGAAGTLALLLVGAALMLLVMARTRSRLPRDLRFGCANLVRRRGATILQVLAIGLGTTVMLVLTVIRGDLLESWQEALPEGAPNHFLLNIQPGEATAMQRFFDNEGIRSSELYPMIRGRLVGINDRTVSPDDYSDPGTQRLVDREFNLSFTSTPQTDNRVVAGRWYGESPADIQQFSAEVGIAETLGFGLGDTLRFQVADREVTATVTSLREVDWDSFNVNFFVVGPPQLLQGYPSTRITNFHLLPEQRALLVKLVRAFPSVTVIDIDAVMSQVRTIMARVSRAVEFIFAFTISAGFLVLVAALRATHDERLSEAATLKAIGAERRAVRAGLVAEFSILGLTAGLVATFAGGLISYLLASQVFNLPLTVGAPAALVGVLGCVMGVTLVGLWQTREVLSAPVMRVLR